MTARPERGNGLQFMLPLPNHAWAFILGATALFCVAQFSPSANNGWRLDESFALWASDTSLPFSRVVDRIFPDTDPQIYFSPSYWARLFVGNDHRAIPILNVAFVAAADLLVSLPAWAQSVCQADMAQHAAP